jgi:hypothetical protein
MGYIPYLPAVSTAQCNPDIDLQALVAVYFLTLAEHLQHTSVRQTARDHHHTYARRPTGQAVSALLKKGSRECRTSIREKWKLRAAGLAAVDLYLQVDANKKDNLFSAADAGRSNMVRVQSHTAGNPTGNPPFLQPVP